MKLKSTDTNIDFTVKVKVNGVGKKATKADNELAAWFGERASAAIIAMAEYYGKVKATEYSPGKYYFGTPR